MSLITENSFPAFSSGDYSSMLWNEEDKKLLLRTPIMDICSVKRNGPEGRSGDFINIDTPLWVSVLPFFTGTDGIEYFVMERQYRHGSNSITIEFPGGLVNEGEKPEDAAKRELLEETGIIAKRIKCIGNVNPNSAFMTTRQYIFLAENLDVTETRNFDDNEQIDTIVVPVNDVLSNLGKGMYDNGIMLIGAFCFIQRGNCKTKFGKDEFEFLRKKQF